MNEAIMQLLEEIMGGNSAKQLSSRIIDMLNESETTVGVQIDALARAVMQLQLSVVQNQSDKRFTGVPEEDLAMSLTSFGKVVGEISGEALRIHRATILTKSIRRVEEWMESPHCDCESCDERAAHYRRVLPVLREELAKAETSH